MAKLADEIVAELRGILEEMRSSDLNPELEGIPADVAFELGYETAIYDINRMSEPGLEVTFVTVRLDEDGVV